MSRVLQPTPPTQTPVLPGTSVISQIPMATSVSAGDYVYLTSSGYGVGGTTASFGVNTVYWPYGSFNGYTATSTLASAQYGPSSVVGTYTGSTITAGQQLVGQTQLSSSNSAYQKQFCALTNGNFVFVYNTTNNTWYFKIVSPTGTTVAGPTLVASNVIDTPYRSITVCPLAGGGFIIAWGGTSSTGMWANKYNNSGTLITSQVFSYSYTSNVIQLSVGELSNGSIVFAWVYPNNNYAAFFIQSSDLATNIVGSQYLDTSYATTIYPSYYFGMTPLFGGGFATCWYDGSYGARMRVFTNNTASADAARTSSNVSSTYTANTLCPLSDGGFVIINNTGTIYAYRYSNTYSPTASSAIASGASSNAGTVLTPIQSNQLAISWFNNSTGYPYIAFSTSTSGGTSWGSPILIASTNLANQNGNYGYTFAANASGQIALPMALASASYSQDFLIVSSVALTNGQSLTGTSLGPPNYLFQGVSLNTVSAGQTANVVLNGPATVNTNYPSVPTPTFFDFSGTGQFGNVGYVYGRNVTLKGLE